MLAEGRATLLGLWGEPGAVHMAVIGEGAGEIAVVSLDCVDGNFPSVGALHPPAIRLERALREGLAPLAALSWVGDVRVIGGVGAVELAGKGYLDELGPRLAAAFLERGLLLRPLGNVVYFMPPYCITESETSWALDQITAVLRAPSLW